MDAETARKIEELQETLSSVRCDLACAELTIKVLISSLLHTVRFDELFVSMMEDSITQLPPYHRERLLEYVELAKDKSAQPQEQS